MRHWLVTEIGGTHYESLHIHGIVWTDKLDEVERIWQYGHVWKGKKENEQIVNYVNERTASYIIKYMTKVDEKHPNYKSIIFTSKGIGGTSQEIVFQEVISNSASEDEPLGTLAGRGVTTSKQRGGHIKIKVTEPGYIMCISSITPRIDY